MVRRFVCVAGIIVLVLLLAIAVQAALVSTDGAERADDTPLVCLALVGGTALLAGSVWMGRLRRMLP
ncbi:MAG: hypothetical protein V3T90_04605 [Anaerolineae bacterium]